MKTPVLKVENLFVTVKDQSGLNQVVKGISFVLNKGECLGILGESGSGKSITMKAIIGILDSSFSVSGEAIYNGKNLIGAPQKYLRKLRGQKITLVMQHPMACFDPLFSIEKQMKETLRTHTSMADDEMEKKLLDILNFMCIRQPDEVLKKYPHQLSGGMLQRVMIGLALVMDPDIIIADEPTTAIDAITQYEIIQEFLRIKNQRGKSIVFISHDIGVISAVADKVLVMNQGCVVDQGKLDEIIKNASDPYTRQLIRTRNKITQKYEESVKRSI
ncbi:ABC transporter ATP-binding protein [Marinisporobacter balticus]|uniref:Nickel transport system ATP-binding protein n=1 Tax=Marinisporobacter balticus TaxID=2018667 RepID=A0A4R2K9R7_9FIRM|nr:ABC transporter ATP-binding protein [Marinisporobacter balticus]TCO68727.1 nickel transport system ATP-binding protein [Marinisporobacter balticus]